MDRHQRYIIQQIKKFSSNSAVMRSAEKAARNANVPINEFLDWVFEDLALKYKEERMNQRIIIENKVKQLGLRFPNGTVNKEYSYCFELPTELLHHVELEGGEEVGLMLVEGENGKYAICGRPKKAGDFKVKLRYLTLEGEPASELVLPIAFNPNPRDLWKDIPTPKSSPFYKPDSDSKYIKVEAGIEGAPRKDLVAASRRGRSHAQEGKDRDDHFALHFDRDSEWYVIAVADGAGSSKFSRRGSEIACNTVVDHCKSLLTDNYEFEQDITNWASDREDNDKRTKVTRKVIDIIFNGAIKAHENIRKEAEASPGTTIKDFATTLMFAICKKYKFGWFIASFWVGDGAMAIYDESTRNVKLLGTPDEGEFSGQTRFLTMAEIFHDKEVLAKRLRMSIVPDFTALFLMTDGVSDPMFETDKNLNDFNKWKEFYEKLKGGFPEDEIKGVDLNDDNTAAKGQLLKWLDFWSPGNHDDRTIAILY